MISDETLRIIEALLVAILSIIGGRSLQISQRTRKNYKALADELQDQVGELTDRAELFEQRYNETNAMRIRQSDLLEAVQKEHTADRRTIDQLNVRLEFIEGERAKEFEKYQAERDGYMKGWGRLEEKVSQMEKQQHTDGEKIKTLEAKVLRLEADKRQLEEENRELLAYKKSCEDLTKQVATLTHDLELCRNSRRELESRIRLLEKPLDADAAKHDAEVDSAAGVDDKRPAA